MIDKKLSIIKQNDVYSTKKENLEVGPSLTSGSNLGNSTKGGGELSSRKQLEGRARAAERRQKRIDHFRVREREYHSNNRDAVLARKK